MALSNKAERNLEDIPEGTALFDVANTTIKDDMGFYCEPGEKAVLSEKHATLYRDMGYIRPDLPDFGPDNEKEEMAIQIEELKKRLAAAESNNEPTGDPTTVPEGEDNEPETSSTRPKRSRKSRSESSTDG